MTLADIACDADIFQRQGRSPRLLRRIWGEKHWRGHA
jgi:hypothetical protein